MGYLCARGDSHTHFNKPQVHHSTAQIRIISPVMAQKMGPALNDEFINNNLIHPEQ